MVRILDAVIFIAIGLALYVLVWKNQKFQTWFQSVKSGTGTGGGGTTTTTDTGGTSDTGGTTTDGGTGTGTQQQPTGDKTDKTNLSFTSGSYTSKYHLYAGGLDWSKSVGLLIYADGSGEYGLKNLNDSYLMPGGSGLIAVAKKHNMVLLTPFSPNTNCSDGDGSCWYLGDSPGYARWAEALVKQVESQYAIDKKRIAFGGYSSGAQLATEWWVPSGAAQRTMDAGVIVAISYGGTPKMSETSYTQAFKTNVHMSWNVGSKDPSYTGDGQYSVKPGYDHYTAAGFKTSLELVPGLTHKRDGQFGGVMDAEISKYVTGTPATAATARIPYIFDIMKLSPFVFNNNDHASNSNEDNTLEPTTTATIKCSNIRR